MKTQSFLRRNPLAFAAVPIALAAVTLALLFGLFNVIVGPYMFFINWFFSSDQMERQPQDLFAQASEMMEGSAAVEDEDPRQTIPLSSITYPVKGDVYGRITISGTTVDAPVYYGDDTAQLNRGVGTYVDKTGAGIPGESKTILMAGHNNTFFNDLQSVEPGAIVTIETHYATYTYTVEKCEVKDYEDETAYDFTREDENLILYTCYPFDAMGFTPNRYFVYASYTSGPRLAADE